MRLVLDRASRVPSGGELLPTMATRPRLAAARMQERMWNLRPRLARARARPKGGGCRSQLPSPASGLCRCSPCAVKSLVQGALDSLKRRPDGQLPCVACPQEMRVVLWLSMQQHPQKLHIRESTAATDSCWPCMQDCPVTESEHTDAAEVAGRRPVLAKDPTGAFCRATLLLQSWGRFGFCIAEVGVCAGMPVAGVLYQKSQHRLAA